MADKKNGPPIIIKKKKVVAGGGHHGGAWKVAYADFVTAMMAFFMLMWLLNATTEKQRKGIADYFSPTIPVNRISGGGDAVLGGDSVFTEDSLSQNGTGSAGTMLASGGPATGSEKSGESTSSESGGDAETFAKVESALTARAGESMVSSDLARHILVRVTDEGLIVELFDLPNQPLFDGETAEPTETAKQLAAIVARVFGGVKNPLAINGHVSSRPLVLLANPVWELSSARADSFRTLLESAGFEMPRVQRQTGFADRKPAEANPMSARNNRIELILLRSKL